MSEYLFFLKSHEGHYFKILSDMLQNNMKNVCLNLTEDGITMQNMDTHKTILFDMIINSDKFQSYKYNFDTPSRQIGLTLRYLYSMLKNMKKKDVIEIYILKSKPDCLGVRVIPNNSNKITNSFIQIHLIQNILIDKPDEYKHSVLIETNDFQKVCKDMSIINNDIEIISGKDFIKFECKMDNVYSKDVIFGDFDEIKIIHRDVFDLDNLIKIIKMSGLSKHCQVYLSPNVPLKFHVAIGCMGTLNIYVKSKQQME